MIGPLIGLTDIGAPTCEVRCTVMIRPTGSRIVEESFGHRFIDDEARRIRRSRVCIREPSTAYGPKAHRALIFARRGHVRTRYCVPMRRRAGRRSSTLVGNRPPMWTTSAAASTPRTLATASAQPRVQRRRIGRTVIRGRRREDGRGGEVRAIVVVRDPATDGETLQQKARAKQQRDRKRHLNGDEAISENRIAWAVS